MTRPTASRRVVRRRYSILGVLAERGPSTGIEICYVLRRATGTIYPDLAWMEGYGLIASEWADEPHPRRRLYRLADKGGVS